MKSLIKSRFLTLTFVSSLCLLANAGSNKIFEVKITATPIITSGGNNETVLYAGNKNFNVVNLLDGKMKMDKTYKETGTTIAKASDASFDDDILVICDAKTVSCIDLLSGKKIWENNSFIELDANNMGALEICDNYVLVSDKKQKDNFILTCLNINDGKKMWSVENLKNKVKPDNIYTLSGNGFVAFIVKGKVSQLNVVNLETGKVSYNGDIEGDPVYTLSDEISANVFIHNWVSETTSFVTAINLKQGNLLWKTKTANKSITTPQTMNTNVINYYASMDTFDDKVLLKTEGVEVFDVKTGKSLYNIPFVPYYKWGVGHYVNGIFDPIVTSTGILLADRTSGDLYIKMYDKNTGKLLWTSEKLKGKDCAPTAIVAGNSIAVQFGGLNYFEVINNGAIGKLLDPFNVTSFDLHTGKINWTLNSKKNFYYIAESKDNVMIVGKSDFQTIDPQTGKILKTDDNPFGEDYFMTTFTLNSTHKVQKDVVFDFSSRTLFKSDGNKLQKFTF